MLLLRPSQSFKQPSWRAALPPSSIFSAGSSVSDLGSHLSLQAISSSFSSSRHFFSYLSYLKYLSTLLTVLLWNTLDSHLFCYKRVEVSCLGSLSFRPHYLLHLKASPLSLLNLIENLLPWSSVLAFPVSLSLSLDFWWKLAAALHIKQYYQLNAIQAALKSFLWRAHLFWQQSSKRNEWKSRECRYGFHVS